MAPVSKELLEWGKKQKIKETMYYTKPIRFFGNITPIILQNENGPCPLLAICNILSLRNELRLSPYETSVSERELLRLVAENLLISNRKDEETQKTISDTIDILPLVAKGLDVNVRFTRIKDIEFTSKCAVFRLLNIPVYHGWIIDPQDVETSNAIGLKSYDTLTADLAKLETQNTEGVTTKSSEEDLHEPLMGLELTKTVYSSSEKVGDCVTFKTDPDKASHVGKTSTSEPERHESKDETVETDPDKASRDGKTNTSEPEKRESKDRIEEASLEEVKITEKSVTFGETTSSEASSSTLNIVTARSPQIKELISRPLTARQGELVRDFLENNVSQLTVYGLFCLHEGLEERELCAFFRNNHFNTMLKYGGALYLLVTDLGYKDEPGVIWEKLSEVNGDTVFVNQYFKIYKPEIERYTRDKKSVEHIWSRAYPETDYTAEASTSRNTDKSSDPPLAGDSEQVVPEAKQRQKGLEEEDVEKVIQDLTERAKRREKEKEEEQRSPPLAGVWQELVLEAKQHQQSLAEKQSQREIEEIQPQRVSPTPPPTGSNVREHHSSIRPRNLLRNLTRKPLRNPLRNPTRNPLRNPPRKESKRSKEKCSLM
ncbi:ubiquitin carboxyl-terminal hydrolase MINDY-2 [Helianthus annuus]|uniref:ubiquitin carboxyl-terminal hydrolase MINDY-2 n=1 Tax=Helianthus annuus TaxID=4232 RepID=UPI000B8F5E30|nr:ubiquitin carboxyl-terminal hydrolase MINDY-2 [Helianthus annuus]